MPELDELEELLELEALLELDEELEELLELELEELELEELELVVSSVLPPQAVSMTVHTATVSIFKRNINSPGWRQGQFFVITEYFFDCGIINPKYGN